MGASLEQWLGAVDAKAPRQLLDEAAQALKSAVKLRVEAAKEQFEALKKAERERLAAEALLRQPQHQRDLFAADYDGIWTESCPACKCRAFTTGEQTGEDISEEQDEGVIWEIVDREFVGEEFRCPTCDLTLTGSAEIEAAGLDDIHEDRQEREMEHEPDYGND
ncbi:MULTISPECIES: hypothetical protein [Mesorhizobium]|uniref:hypothetical protein n=1 Tax=Mesorhizobium TaxID=68287 RepID=UPI0003CE730D|nr:MULTISPECIES: hypothetical protein [Mesorhizobium]ESY62404.1 hypothetical protein X742_33115 [Mesorhizobium sp. LNHC232B00]WJI38235.1 hypothetical protein NL534_30960 [Mesorhizobium opportunistum]